MIKSYFFIPSNRLDFINKIEKIDSDFFIFDLEDSINDSSYTESINNLINLTKKPNYFVRTKFIDNNNNFFSNSFKDTIELGFYNYVIPKLESDKQSADIENYLLNNYSNDFNKFYFILLVESPKALMFLKENLVKTNLNIIALALGSHDYCDSMGMKHQLKNLEFARQFVLNMAKAFGICSIDIASMDMKNFAIFKKEAISAFNMGYESKFILHPKQLEILKTIIYYNKDEIKEAKLVFDSIRKVDMKDFTVIKVNDKLYERPHIKKILNIIEWSEKYGIQ